MTRKRAEQIIAELNNNGVVDAFIVYHQARGRCVTFWHDGSIVDIYDKHDLDRFYQDH